MRNVQRILLGDPQWKRLFRVTGIYLEGRW